MPVPPGPVSVSRRTSSRESSASTSLSSRSRPRNGVEGMGRFVWCRLSSGGKSSLSELVDALGRRQVLQPVLAEVAQPVRADRAKRWRRRPAPGRRGRRRRCARPGARRPRRTLVADVRRAGVDAHAHAESGLRPVLRSASSAAASAARRRPEGDEEGVPLRVHLDAAVGCRTPRAGCADGRRAPAAYSAAPSSCRSVVEPSTSVKRKVTVPEGRSRRTRHHAPRRRFVPPTVPKSGTSHAHPRRSGVGRPGSSHATRCVTRGHNGHARGWFGFARVRSHLTMTCRDRFQRTEQRKNPHGHLECGLLPLWTWTSVIL